MIFAKTKSVHGTRKELITVYTMIGLESGSTIVKNVLAPRKHPPDTHGLTQGCRNRIKESLRHKVTQSGCTEYTRIIPIWLLVG